MQREHIFQLTYLDKCPVSLGQRLESPIIDDTGAKTEFIGEAYVISIESICVFNEKTHKYLVSVKQIYTL